MGKTTTGYKSSNYSKHNTKGDQTMKRSFTLLLVLVLVSALLATGCTSGTATPEAPKEGETTYITLATGTTGGSYYPIGASMAKIWTDNIPNMNANVQSTGGTNQNIELMASGDSEAGFTDTKYVFAYEGKGNWEGKPQTWLRGLVPLYPEPTNIVMAKGAKITSLEDLRGMRVSIGAVGSGTESTARELFKVLGMDADKDIKAFMLGTGDTAKAFQDKQIDAAILVGSLGMSAVVEITALDLVEFMDVPDETFEKVFAENNTWVRTTIPAGTYQNQDKDVLTYAAFNIISVHESIPEDLAYQMTKTLFENKDDLIAVRPTMESMTLENVEKIVIPLHPGAIKYYKEMGVTLP